MYVYCRGNKTGFRPMYNASCWLNCKSMWKYWTWLGSMRKYYSGRESEKKDGNDHRTCTRKRNYFLKWLETCISCSTRFEIVKQNRFGYGQEVVGSNLAGLWFCTGNCMPPFRPQFLIIVSTQLLILRYWTPWGNP